MDAAQADDLDGALAALDEGVKLAQEYCSVYNNRFVDTHCCVIVYAYTHHMMEPCTNTLGISVQGPGVSTAQAD